MPNLQTLLPLILTLTLMPGHTNSQTTKIILGANERLTVKMFTPEKFRDMKKSGRLSPAGAIPIHGVTRTFETVDGEVALELYNGAAVMARSREEASQLQKVKFLRLLYSGKRNEFSFMVDIDEPTFNTLKERAARLVVHEALGFFGEAFYRMDSGHVLVQWSPRFSPGKYAILENLRTMIGIDFELAEFLEDPKPSPEASDIPEIKTEERADELNFEIENGKQTNLEAIRAVLSAALNINKGNLDVSPESINEIETSLFWNADNLDPRELLTPCAAYLGEILARKYNLEWEVVEGYYDYGRLKSQTGRRIDIVEKLNYSMIDTDYGIPEVKWVVAEITDILEREKK